MLGDPNGKKQWVDHVDGEIVKDPNGKGFQRAIKHD